MMNKRQVLKILEYRYIRNYKYQKIADDKTVNCTRQTISNICKYYDGIRIEYLESYFNGTLDKFWKMHPYKRDGRQNRVLDDDDRKDIKKIVKKKYIDTYKKACKIKYGNPTKTSIGIVIAYLKLNSALNEVSYSTLYRFLIKAFPDYFLSKEENSDSENS